jgi:flagellar biosynthesis protein FlhF
MITQEFGNEAVILSSKKCNDGVEVLAALDYDEALLPEKRMIIDSKKDSIENKKENNMTKKVFSDNDSSTQKENKYHQKNSKISPIMDEMPINNDFHLKKTLNNVSEELNELKDIKTEIHLMRSAMTTQMSQLHQDYAAEKNPLFMKLKKRALSLGLSDKVIKKMISKIKLTHNNEKNWTLFLNSFQSMMRFIEKPILHQGTFIFIGGCGVGKTTALIKCAIHSMIHQEESSVALITMKHYRTLKEQSLYYFSKLLNIPIKQVTEKKSLSDVLSSFSDKKLILIDTPAFKHCDGGTWDEEIDIHQMMNALPPLVRMNIKKLFVFPVTQQRAVVEKMFQQLSEFSMDYSVMTHLDECIGLGESVSFLLDNQVPLLLTTGSSKISEPIQQSTGHELLKKMIPFNDELKITPMRRAKSQPFIRVVV